MSIPLLCLAALAADTSSSEASVFSGVWIADLNTQAGLPRDEYLVRRGNYSCMSCNPPRTYAADGKPRPVKGDRNVISESVTVVGPHTIVTRIITPTMSRVTRMTVAKDGRTATYVSLDSRKALKGILRTEYRARRVSAGPAGSHPVSGVWQGVRYVGVPKQLRTTELRDEGNQLTYRVPTGFTYTAKFGGDFVRIEGPDDGNILAAVERVSAVRIVERRKQGDKIILVRTYTVAPNGRSLEIASFNPITKTTFTVTARK